MNYQKTIAEPVSLEGTGLHTGNSCKITFRPAPPNSGIRFFRTDLPGRPCIPAKLLFVVDTARGTTIGINGTRIHTIEHVLAACSGLGIDNVDIEITNNEPPATDGSALLFLRALLTAGMKEQPDFPKRALRLSEPVVYESGGIHYTAEPAASFQLQVTILHDHPILKKQSLRLEINPETFFREIAAARTFCFEHEIEFLRKQGLARGGSLDNAVVIGRDRIHTNPAGLRFPDEFVRHKLLDLVGDLYLLGRGIQAKIRAVRCGHTHNIQFAKKLNEEAKKCRR